MFPAILFGVGLLYFFGRLSFDKHVNTKVDEKIAARDAAVVKPTPTADTESSEAGLSQAGQDVIKNTGKL